MSEHDEQVTFFDYVRLKAKQDSRYASIFAIPNGGHRHKAVAGKLKAEGVQSGVPDIFVATPTSSYPGMFIEAKFGRNKPSKNQKEWLERLADNGYRVVVCWSSSDMIAALEAYLVT